ncbi:hypothetical protein D9M71_503890 [compost metagenome]
MLRQVGAGGDEAAAQVVIGDGLEQRIELTDTQAPATIRRQQLLAATRIEVLGALQDDGANGEAASVRRLLCRLLRGGLAG